MQSTDAICKETAIKESSCRNCELRHLCRGSVRQRPGTSYCLETIRNIIQRPWLRHKLPIRDRKRVHLKVLRDYALEFGR